MKTNRTGEFVNAAKRVSMPIGGIQSFALPSEESPGMELVMTGIRSFPKMPLRGPRLEFALVSPSNQTVDSVADNRVTVYVDYARGLASTSAWHCIFNSIPEARANAPGVIDLPMEYRMGFYRLRVE